MDDFCSNGALVVPQAFVAAQMGILVDDSPAGALDGAKVRLFTNDYIPSPTSVLADFDEATFGGYTAADASWGPVHYNEDGGAGASGGAPEWVTSGAGPDETVYGWFLTNAAGTTLLGARRLAVAQPATGTGQQVQVNVDYYLPGPVGNIVPPV